MSELPEFVCRAAKRLHKLAKNTGGTLSVPNLSAAQDVVAKLHGARTTFDALMPAKADLQLDEIELALSIGNLMGSDAFTYFYYNGDPDAANDEIVFRLWSDDLKAFQFRDDAITGGPWDPADDPHVHMRYEIAISLRGCGAAPGARSIMTLAKDMFDFLANKGSGYVFAYLSDKQICQLSSGGREQ